jgi:AcrR family transcriptional regulator
MPSERKRLSPDESRAAALSAAHDILLADGPQAVTLKAVAAKVGRTHANLLHHFGTAFAQASPTPSSKRGVARLIRGRL